MPRYSADFKNKNSNKLWTKSFRSKESCFRAIKGITSKTNNISLGVASSKGYKFGKININWNTKYGGNKK